MPRHGSLLLMLLAGLLARCDRSHPSTSTQPATAPAGVAALDKSVRVVLLRDVPDCVISIRGPFDVVNANSGAVLGTIDHSLPLTVTFTNGTTLFVELQRAFTAVALDLRPATDGAAGLQFSDGLRRYRGWLRLVRRAPDNGCIVNVVDVEDYLPGVVTAEMSPSFQLAALRAQAIASRTFAWYKKRTYGPGHDWDMTSNESSQVYRGLSAETTPGLRAVNDTAGIVCAWASPDGERIFPAHYNSTCGGVTRPVVHLNGEPDVPALAGNVSCEFCAASPAYRWAPIAIPKKQISDRLRARYPRLPALGAITGLTIVQRTAKGRPTRVALTDDTGQKVELDVNEFRSAVDPTGRVLKSGHFTPVDQVDAIQFTDGRGMGHGWGMCQYGANGLAKAGRTATEILEFYYPGCRLVRAY